MKKTLTALARNSSVAALLVFVLNMAVVPVASAAPTGGIGGGADAAKGSNTPTDLFGDGGMFQTITDVLLFVIGAVAVIMLIVGGIRYTVSGGDSNAITSAKNTILYAIVGIIVAILAYAVVHWVIGSFSQA